MSQIKDIGARKKHQFGGKFSCQPEEKDKLFPQGTVKRML